MHILLTFLLLAACGQPEPVFNECDREAAGPLAPLPLHDARVDEADWIDPMAGAGVTVGDIDGDGLRDLILAQRGPAQLLIQTPDGDFVDQTEVLWPEVRTDLFSAAAHMVDIDGDEDLDVFVCHNGTPGRFVDQPNALFINDGTGALADASAAWGVDQMVRPCYGASFGDINGDEDLDIALANYDPCEGDGCDRILDWPSPQILWVQTPVGFIDVSDRLGERASSSLPHLASLLDVDGDLDVDLFLVNDDRGDIDFSEHTLLYLNDGEGLMDLADPLHGAEHALEAMGLGIGDLNGDLAVDMVMPGVEQFALMESLPGGGWCESAKASALVVSEGTGRHYGWGTVLADLDNDGDLDIPVVFGQLLGEPGPDNPEQQPDALYLNDGEGMFEEVAEAWGFDDRGTGRGMVVSDLNGDGWLDIIKRELMGPPRAYTANCGAAAWLEVSLRQDGANSHAIGAVVTATAGDRSWRRWVVLGGTGLSSSGDGAVHIGLGDVDVLDTLAVIWPDGAETVLTDVDTRQALRVER